MKKFTLILLLTQLSFSQTIEDAWVYFKNKPSSTTFLANPLSMLTQRAIDRRVAQNISIDITDVPVEESFISQIKSSSGITIMAKSRWLNCLHIRGTQSNINNLKSLPFVDKVVWARKNLNITPKIQKVDKWKNEVAEKINYNYGNSANQVQMLNIHELHKQNFEGEGKIIAVMDGGFPGVDKASSFQNLRTNNQILGGYNFPDANDNIYTRNSHGTNCLSAIGSIVDGKLIGTAPKSKFYLFITEVEEFENPVEESYWVEAAELADYYGVDVISTSLGYVVYDDAGYSHTSADMVGDKTFASKGSNIAFSKGIVLVTAAGNSGASANPYISTPSDANGCLCVGAVDSSKMKASFSSIGLPNSIQIKPDVMAKGVSASVSNTSGTITTSNGTSFSTPIMAGAIASFWSARPTLTAKEIVDIVRKSSDRFSNPNKQYGYGIPDFQLALNSTLDNSSFDTNLVDVSPNPAKDFVKITVNNLNNNIFVLYNAFGQKIIQQVFDRNENIIELQSLPKGIYYYELTANGSLKGKLIKN